MQSNINNQVNILPIIQFLICFLTFEKQTFENEVFPIGKMCQLNIL